MDKAQQQEFQEAVQSLAKRYDAGGHILIYLDGEQFRFAGNLNMAAIGPVLTRLLAARMLGAVK